IADAADAERRALFNEHGGATGRDAVTTEPARQIAMPETKQLLHSARALVRRLTALVRLPAIVREGGAAAVLLRGSLVCSLSVGFAAEHAHSVHDARFAQTNTE